MRIFLFIGIITLIIKFILIPKRRINDRYVNDHQNIRIVVPVQKSVKVSTEVENQSYGVFYVESITLQGGLYHLRRTGKAA